MQCGLRRQRRPIVIRVHRQSGPDGDVPYPIDCASRMTPLPIDPHLPQITDAVRKHRTLVLVAEPGAGKTTRVPPALLRANLLSAEHPNVVMLQPRRVAARASAERI